MIGSFHADPPYQTSDSIPGVEPDGVFGSPHRMVTSPDPAHDLVSELVERHDIPLGGFPGDHGMNNWVSEHPNNHTYVRAGPTYPHATRTATRSHTHTHNRTSVSVSSVSNYSFSAMDPHRGSPFDVQREQVVSDRRSLSLPPSVLGYPLPVADPQYNYLNYQFGDPSAPTDANYYPQWVTRTGSSQSDGDPSPTPPEGEATGTLRQVRVGSDRTRAISQARRTNPNKKLFYCDVPGCGANLTSMHNFKSQCLESHRPGSRKLIPVLTGHQNSHLGRKPHKCGQGCCKKSFGTSAEAKRHRLHHCNQRPV